MEKAEVVGKTKVRIKRGQMNYYKKSLLLLKTNKINLVWNLMSPKTP